MEVIYRAYDGKIFESAEKCVIYEQALAVPMYGEGGKTNDPDKALVVAFNDDYSAEAFINKCQEAGTLHEGINEGDKGTFVWDYIEDRYFTMDVSILDALRHYFKDNP